MRALLLIAGAVAGLEAGHRLGRKRGQREGYLLRFCPNCLKTVSTEGFVSQ